MDDQPPVYAFEWDEDNEEHLAEHGVGSLEVDQTPSNRHKVVPNRGREPRMFLIGETHGGRVLTVVIEPTRVSGTWRPVTAWDANEHEQRQLRGGR